MARRKVIPDEEIFRILFEDQGDEDYCDNFEELNALEDNDESVNNLDEQQLQGTEGRHSDEDSDDETVTVQETAAPARKRFRKTLTKERIINNLESSLHLGNYNLLNTIHEKKVMTCILEKGTKNRPATTLPWCNVKDVSRGRQTAENIISTTPGPINGSNLAQSPFDCWKLFMNTPMINLIVISTNNQIDRKLNAIDLTMISERNKCHLKHTNAEEMTAFIGLLYARGMLNLSHHSLKYLFQDVIGHPIFGATMSSNRFWFLNSNIRFDDYNTRQERFKQDRFAAFREIYEMFNDRCSSVIQPDEYLSLDETLYGCKNQISFKQYNSSKPQKYGILFKSINAVKYPFTFRTCVYSGKPLGEPGPFYIRGIMPTVQSLVTQLSAHVDIKGRNITMDRLYTSYELFK